MIILAITSQKENFQSLLEVASWTYLTQLRSGCIQNVNFWVTFTPRFYHSAFELDLKSMRLLDYSSRCNQWRNPHDFVYVQSDLRVF